MSDIAAPVRFSHLRAYGRSAAHGQHARTMEEDETASMERGTAVHAIIFGTRKVIAYPGLVRRGKEYDAFVEKHPDSEILTVNAYDSVNRMADAIRASEIAAQYLKGVHEETLLFKWMGMDCRVTPDVRGLDYVTELKTAASADPSKFIWDARRRHYHAQLRFQEFGCAAKKIRIRDHWIVCVESEVPHPVTVFHLEPEAREEGEKCLILWAERMKACEAAGHFPPYVECTVPLVWPKEFDLEYEEAA